MLVCRGSKFTFFLLYLFALPLFLEMNTVLKLWLKNPPNQSVLFTRLIIIETVLISVSYSIMTLVQATGKIKLYQGVVGGILLLNLPLSYFALKLAAPAHVVMVIAILVEVMAFFARMIVVRYLTSFSISLFFFNTICPCIFVSVISAILPCLVIFTMNESFFRLCITIFVSVMSIGSCILFIGMNKLERQSVIGKIIEQLQLGGENE